MSDITHISRYFAIISTIFEFSSFWSDQEMLCRISKKKILASNLGLVRKMSAGKIKPPHLCPAQHF